MKRKQHMSHGVRNRTMEIPLHPEIHVFSRLIIAGKIKKKSVVSLV